MWNIVLLFLLSVSSSLSNLIFLSNFHWHFRALPCYPFFGKDFPEQPQLSVLIIELVHNVISPCATQHFRCDQFYPLVEILGSAVRHTCLSIQAPLLTSIWVNYFNTLNLGLFIQCSFLEWWFGGLKPPDHVDRHLAESIRVVGRILTPTQIQTRSL